jgi:hypothetical protein
MNSLDQLLQDDLHRLIDRIAATAEQNVAIESLAGRTELARRLGDAETRLSALRLDLLSGYLAWQEALQECGDLWALAALSVEPTTCAELRAA